MSQEIPDTRKMLSIVEKQEEELQFDSFTFEDGWELGLLTREQVLAHGGNAAIDVTVGCVQLFRCGVGMPTPNNSRWIRRKMNVALENWKSSLRVSLEMNLSGRTLDDFGLKGEDFALSGGSFPIRVRGQGVVGTVTVSGLPQTHDHQMAANALAQLLKTRVVSILE